MTIPSDKPHSVPVECHLAAAMPSASDLDLLDLLGYFYLQHGMAEKAAVLIAARVALAPADARVLMRLALAYMRAGNSKQALETLERVALTRTIDPAYHLLRAKALQRDGRAADAAIAMHRYIETFRLLREETHTRPEAA